MAHFARLDENNVVVRVHVLANPVIIGEDGTEDTALGIAYLTKLHGEGPWVQTSYNSNFRKNFAGRGMVYDAERDAFIEPKPSDYPSFVFNEETCRWEPPIPRPPVGTEDDDNLNFSRWDEENGAWVTVEVPQGSLDDPDWSG